MKTNLDQAYKSNETMESEGNWFRISKDVRFRLKRFGGSNSQDVQQAMAKYHKPYSKAIEKGTIDDKTLKEIMAKTFVNACLVDWEGVVIDGEEASFEFETAVKFFCALPDLLTDLWSYVTDGTNFREELGNF